MLQPPSFAFSEIHQAPEPFSYRKRFWFIFGKDLNTLFEG
jgi:hypothetical protein